MRSKAKMARPPAARAAETAGGKLNAGMDAVSAPNRAAKKPTRDFQEAWKGLRLASAFCVIWVVVG
jgi:hypothetical protein